MSAMLDATERTKPVMQYIRQLETKVRTLQQERLRFESWIFLFGYAAGAASAAAVWYLVLHR